MNPPPSPKIRLSSWLWPTLVGLLLLLEIAFPYRGWVLLLTGLGLMWGISLLWARAMARGLSLKRELRYGWAQVGDMLEERFTVTNNSRLPAVWVEVIDHSTIPGYQVSRASGVEGRGHNEWRTRQTCTRRGIYTIGPTSLISGDPFGIYTVTLHNPASATLLVTPPILPLPTIEVAPGGRTGEGRPSTRALERSVSAAGLRDYVPGDSLRWIHWPSLARRGRFMVKLFDNTPASDWWILIDLDRGVQRGEGLSDTEEMGVTLAASLAARGLAAGLAVGLGASGDALVWMPPAPGEAQRWKILNALARVTAGSLPLASFLERLKDTIHNQTSLVLITPSADAAWLDPLLALARRGVVPTVLLASPESPPAEPLTTLAGLLAELRVASTIVTPELFAPAGLIAAPRNAWEWRVMPTGKVIPVRQPTDVTWRTLG